MLKKLNKTMTLTGKSGKEYEFDLWSFEDFDDVKGAFEGSGLYVFTRRYLDGNKYKHNRIYLGETGDYSTRFDNHHREQCIRKHGANCIGLYSMPNSTEKQRKDAENDLLEAYNFPCNDQNN